jgi:uncharacterized phage protein (TIGR02218 family)
MSVSVGFLEHLATGATSVCQCWAVSRRDGVVLGFTDHDRDLAFEGIVFRAASGMTARALQTGTGLAVDNSEAVGALSDASVSEADLMAGRFDGAEVRNWIVNWQDVSQRLMQFRGSFGEVTRAGGAFRAELRGLTEGLNQVQGLAYQRACSAVLGDARCGVDLGRAGLALEVPIVAKGAAGVYSVVAVAGFAQGWFQRGRARVMTGDAAGLVGLVKFDQTEGVLRRLDLWVDFARSAAVGDVIRLEVGCDKTADTCRDRFSNFANFRGFLHIPGEDWMTSYPVSGKANDGGSLSK